MKDELVAAFGAVHRSLAEIEGAALGTETQLDLLVGQGQSMTKTLGTLVAELGTLVDRMKHQLDNADRQGARINTLERDVRELRNGG
jgi:hypothetical protein